MNNKQLRELFEDFSKVSDKIIEDKKRKGIQAVCIILEKNENEDENDCNKILVPLSYMNYQEKVETRNSLFRIIMEKKIEGYILVQDAKMTIIDKKEPTKEPIVQDVVLRGLYSNKLKIKEAVIYDDKKRIILEKNKLLDNEDKKITKELKGVIDEWDIYGEWWDKDNTEHKKFMEDYIKFKKENPDKFEGVCK
jgi:hypothetical protein